MRTKLEEEDRTPTERPAGNSGSEVAVQITGIEGTGSGEAPQSGYGCPAGHPSGGQSNGQGAAKGHGTEVSGQAAATDAAAAAKVGGEATTTTAVIAPARRARSPDSPGPERTNKGEVAGGRFR